jgi:8-oxo-dGTP pyrophosphatase MutT (NUDIX family)
MNQLTNIVVNRDHVIKANILGQFGVEQPRKWYCNLLLENQNGLFLLLKRSPVDTFHPNEWCLPGGKMEPGEDETAAAARECREETGLNISADMCSKVGMFTKPDCIISYFYTRCKVYNQEIILDNFEHSQYEWVTTARLLNMDLLLDLSDHLNYIACH